MQAFTGNGFLRDDRIALQTQIRKKLIYKADIEYCQLVTVMLYWFNNRECSENGKISKIKNRLVRE